VAIDSGGREVLGRTSPKRPGEPVGAPLVLVPGNRQAKAGAKAVGRAGARDRVILKGPPGRARPGKKIAAARAPDGCLSARTTYCGCPAPALPFPGL